MLFEIEYWILDMGVLKEVLWDWVDV